MKEGIGKTVVRNFSIVFGARAVTWISGFILLLFLPRYLGSQDYGRLYLALSIKMMLGLLVDFGGAYLIPKEVARSEKVGSKILSSYLILRVLLWVVSIGIIIIISHLLGYSEHIRLLILVLAVSMLWEGGSKAYSAYFQGIERMEYSSLGMIAEKVFVAIFAVAALLLGADSFGIAIIMTIGALLHLIVVFLFHRKFATLNFKFDSKVFTLLSSGMPYFLFSLFSVIYYRIDAVMLSSFTSETVTGWYGGAYRFFDMVMMLPLIYKAVIFPVFSKLWDDENGTLQKTISKSLKLIIILGVPASLLIFIYAENVIHFFMGLEEYAGSVIILQIFALSIPIIYVDLIIGSAILGAANRQRAWAFVGFIAIFLNVGVNYFLIPYAQGMYMNGGIGAAVATFITELFMLSSALYLLPNDFLRTFKMAYITKPVIAGAGMVAIVWLLNTTSLYWMLTAAIGGVAYLAGLYVLQLFDDEEMAILKDIASVQGLKMMLSTKNS
ncbi:MAG: flippase [Balneolaceae bacterium]